MPRAKAKRTKVQHNRIGAGAILLARIEAWCRSTGSDEGRLGKLLFDHAGYVPLLRKRLTVTVEKEEAVRALLAAFAEGISGREEAVRRWLLGRRGGVETASPPPPPQPSPGPPLPIAPPSAGAARVMRGALEREAEALAPPAANLAEALRARPELAAAITAAAREEGRPLWELAADLTAMGLQCWIDDRAVVAADGFDSEGTKT